MEAKAPYSQKPHYIERERQLGMKSGTAQHRLRVMVMFWLAQKCNLDRCFRCGDTITSADDFSIDHRKPWLHIGTELFWDLNNIAFSHKRCNYKEKRNNTDYSIHAELFRMNEGAPGTAWCSKHKLYLPLAEFTSNKNRWNGVHDCCARCRSQYRSPGAKRNRRGG